MFRAPFYLTALHTLIRLIYIDAGTQIITEGFQWEEGRQGIFLVDHLIG